MLNRRWFLAGAAVGAAGLAYGGVKLSGPGGNVVVPGRSRARAIRTDAVPPKAADVVIIGGGIVGTAAAYYLARQGVSVALCEKGAIAGEASGRAQGVVAGVGLSPFKLPLVRRSQELWSGLNAETGLDTGFRKVGGLFPFRDPPEREFWEGWLREAQAFVPRARIIGGAEADKLLPANKPWLGAYHDPDAGGVEPVLAAPALAEAAQKLGARIVAPCAVRGFETQGGRVSHVVTEKGAIHTGAVILAGGAWTTMFADKVDVKFPSLTIFTTELRVKGAVGGPGGIALLPGAGVRLATDGSYSVGSVRGRIAITPGMLSQLWNFRDVIASAPWDVKPHLGPYFFREAMRGSNWSLDEASPFERNRILEPDIDTDLVKEMMAALKEQMPSFSKAHIVETWSGAITTTPDNVPVISPVAAIPGLFLASGFTFGMTMGPAAGEAIAALVTGSQPMFDLKPYSHNRYIDGSEIIFRE